MLRPLGDRVIVEKEQVQELVVSGIILQSDAKKRHEKGRVVAVGPGKKDCAMEVSVGDIVMWDKYSAQDIEDSGEKALYIVKSDDIIAIVNE